MKIIAILESLITDGGGFNQAQNAILQMKRICDGLCEFEVFTTKKENVKYLKALGISAEFYKYSILDRLISISFSSPFWQRVLNTLKISGHFENELEKHGADLAYFPVTSRNSNKLQKLNYITTVFDLCHRDSPEFPEVRNFWELHIREQFMHNSLAPALVVLTDSDQLSNRISARYGVDSERLLSMPFSPSPFLDTNLSTTKDSVLGIYDLKDGYFFYPAQLWAHKNHIRILEALLILREKGSEYTVVFAGGDQGNRAHLERFVAKHSLEGQVRFLGFVPADHLRGLYEGSTAVIMPTYFGPTNLPPLEAWMIGKPLIYSSHLQAGVGDAAICVNPDEPGELAEAMVACNDPGTRTNLVKAGHLRLKEVEQQRTKAELKLKEILVRFSARRRCWA